MATKTLTGSYPAGYRLDPTYDTLDITSVAFVGRAGVTTTVAHPSVINNLGLVDGTLNGITLSAGGAITNAGLIEGIHPITANNESATIANNATIASDATGYFVFYTPYYYRFNLVEASSIRLTAGGTITNGDAAN